MATNIENIIDVVVTKATQSATTADFNTPLVLGVTSSDGKAGSPKTQLPIAEYTLATLATELGTGYAANEVYIAVASVLAQNPRCSKVYAGTIAGSNIASELAVVLDTVSDWYCLIPTAHLFSTSGAAAAIDTFISSNSRIYGVMTTSAPSTSSSAYTNPVAGKTRGFAFYHDISGTRSTENAVAAYVAKLFAYQPGSANWNYKSLDGITTDALTPQQATNLDTAKVGYYVKISGAPVTQGGKTGAGEWIDIIVGTDWITARIREEIYALLLNNPKLPMSDAGIQSVQVAIKSVLERAAEMGILQKEGIDVTVPKYADLSASDKSARRVTGITFSAIYEGAINAIGISGTISY